MDQTKAFAYAQFLLKEGNGSGALNAVLKSGKGLGESSKEISTIMRGVRYVLKASKSWINSLDRVSSPPNILFYKGEFTILNKKKLVIVGTRSMSNYAREALTKLLRAGAWSKDVVIISGLAYGVDAMAHRISLQNGISTCAVVAGGLDKGYPRGNQKLYEKIVKKGCVLAEYPPGKPVIKGMFPMRNRLMAGLADMVLVVEGGLNSGSLITANIALELGKDVYAIPGDIDRKVAEGSNELIKNGAGMITNQEDLIFALGIQADVRLDSADEKQVYGMLKKHKELTPEKTANICNMELRKSIDILTKMQIEGILWRNEAGKYVLR